MSNKQYLNLFFMGIVSFLSMYVLMYVMVNSTDNILNNLNQFYMAGIMTSAMIIIELLIMREMYINKKANTIVLAISVIILILFFLFIRRQTAISDKQFLRSMIPHHASAILMCKKATLQDPKNKQLCQNIIINQQSEIDQMKAGLDELN